MARRPRLAPTSSLPLASTVLTRPDPAPRRPRPPRLQQLACMRSLKVSVPVTARTTPNTARSARSGWVPPMKGRPPRAATHSSADCSGGGEGEGGAGARFVSSALRWRWLGAVSARGYCLGRRSARGARAGQPGRGAPCACPRPRLRLPHWLIKPAKSADTSRARSRARAPN